MYLETHAHTLSVIQTVSLCSPDWPGAVVQTGLELMEIHLSLSPVYKDQRQVPPTPSVFRAGWTNSAAQEAEAEACRVSLRPARTTYQDPASM